MLLEDVPTTVIYTDTRRGLQWVDDESQYQLFFCSFKQKTEIKYIKVLKLNLILMQNSRTHRMLQYLLLSCCALFGNMVIETGVEMLQRRLLLLSDTIQEATYFIMEIDAVITFLNRVNWQCVFIAFKTTEGLHTTKGFFKI